MTGFIVIPAKADIQPRALKTTSGECARPDTRFRGNDGSGERS